MQTAACWLRRLQDRFVGPQGPIDPILHSVSPHFSHCFTLTSPQAAQTIWNMWHPDRRLNAAKTVSNSGLPLTPHQSLSKEKKNNNNKKIRLFLPKKTHGAHQSLIRRRNHVPEFNGCYTTCNVGFLLTLIIARFGCKERKRIEEKRKENKRKVKKRREKKSCKSGKCDEFVIRQLFHVICHR